MNEVYGRIPKYTEVYQNIPKYQVSTDGFPTKSINEQQNGEFAMDMNEQIVQ